MAVQVIASKVLRSRNFADSLPDMS
jgi:hypothetical protein